MARCADLKCKFSIENFANDIQNCALVMMKSGMAFLKLNFPVTQTTEH